MHWSEKDSLTQLNKPLTLWRGRGFKKKALDPCYIYFQHWCHQIPHYSHNLKKTALSKKKKKNIFFYLSFSVGKLSLDFTGDMPGLSTPPSHHALCCSRPFVLVFLASLGFCIPLPAPGGLWSPLLHRWFHLFPAGDSVCPKLTRDGGSLS